jgi:hypothetical protein
MSSHQIDSNLISQFDFSDIKLVKNLRGFPTNLNLD